MEKREKILLPIIIVAITISGSFLVALFTPGSFLIHPVFEITTFELGERDEKRTSTIIIKNTGWVQAKDVRIAVEAFLPIEIEYMNCPEGAEIIKEEKNAFEVRLDRMSVNLECSFGITTTEKNSFADVTVTAADSPAYEWTIDLKKSVQLSDFLLPIAVIVVIIMAITTATSLLYIELRDYWDSRNDSKRST